MYFDGDSGQVKLLKSSHKNAWMMNFADPFISGNAKQLQPALIQYLSMFPAH
jgi:hypothetical protein